MTSLIVVCDAAEPVVRHHRQHYDAAARVGVPAHVTVLYPFVTPDRVDGEVRSRMHSVVASIAPFTSAFRRTAWFEESVLFLAPEDPAPWRTLLMTAADAFPEHPPCGGRSPEPVPHLTVAHDESRDVLRRVERAVLPRLPVHQQVTAVELWAGPRPREAVAGRWARVESFPLGPESGS